MAPSIILIRPQMGENIGAAARAMANFGLSDLRLVAPRDGWPNPKASDMAGRALKLVDDAALYATTAEAVADCQFVLATTARDRAMNLPVLDMREGARELHARALRGERCAVMFGPERTGLENEEMIHANAVVSIPVAAEYPSLNLGQAVVVACYEWRMAHTLSPAGGGSKSDRFRGGANAGVSSHPLESARTDSTPRERGVVDPTVAPRAVLDGLFGQLETALDTVNFWRVPAKKEIMWRNIRAGLTRASLTAQEVATWRGIIKSLTER